MSGFLSGVSDFLAGVGYVTVVVAKTVATPFVKVVQVVAGDVVGEFIDDGPFEDLSTLKPKLKIGDIVSVKRGNYQHFMVYIGGRRELCIHFTIAGNPPRSTGDDFMGILDHIIAIPFSDSFKPGEVTLQTIDSIVGLDKCRVANGTAHAIVYGAFEARKPEIIVEKAMNAWNSWNGPGKSPPFYHFIRRNCETFAYKLRYGKIIPSRQACIPNLLSHSRGILAAPGLPRDYPTDDFPMDDTA